MTPATARRMVQRRREAAQAAQNDAAWFEHLTNLLHEEGHPGIGWRRAMTYRNAGYTPAGAVEAMRPTE